MQFLKKQAPNSLKVVSPSFLANKKVALDASLTMYQFLATSITITKNSELIGALDSKGRERSHVFGLIYRTINYLEHQIKPIWVFDGKAPDAKNELLERRKNKKLEALTNMNEAIQRDDMIRAYQEKLQSIRVTEEMRDEAIHLLKLMKIPFVESPAEAESQCVHLVNKGFVDALISQDTDCLAYGSKCTVRGLKSQDLNESKEISIVNIDDVLQELGFTLAEFREFCILCGTDYNDKILQIGPARAYKLIKQYKVVEKVVEYLMADQYRILKHVIPARFNYVEARKLLSEPIVKNEIPEIVFEKPNFDELYKFLINEKNFTESRVKGMINRLEKIYN